MASGFPSANYAVSASTATRNWSITPKTITVQITEAYSTRLDAFSYLYDLTEQGIGVTVNGICGSDVVMFLNIETEGELSTAGFNSQSSLSNATYYFMAINAGSYCLALSDVSNGNYVFSPVEQSWTIAKTNITGITLSDKTVTFNAVPHSISVNKTVSQYGDELSVATPFRPREQATTAPLTREYIPLPLSCGATITTPYRWKPF